MTGDDSSKLIGFDGQPMGFRRRLDYVALISLYKHENNFDEIKIYFSKFFIAMEF